jgi:hypothetical protein
MKLTIAHKTCFSYQSLVRQSTQYLRLTPQNSVHQHIISWELLLPEEAPSF